MPYTDALAPPMRNQVEKDIVKSYGGWTNFCLSYGLKPFNDDENEEAKRILRQFAMSYIAPDRPRPRQWPANAIVNSNRSQPRRWPANAIANIAPSGSQAQKSVEKMYAARGCASVVGRMCEVHRASWYEITDLGDLDPKWPVRTRVERDIVESYGGWSGFCWTHGFGPNVVTEDETKAAILILRRFAKEVEETGVPHARPLSIDLPVATDLKPPIIRTRAERNVFNSYGGYPGFFEKFQLELDPTNIEDTFTFIVIMRQLLKSGARTRSVGTKWVVHCS